MANDPAPTGGAPAPTPTGTTATPTPTNTSPAPSPSPAPAPTPTGDKGTPTPTPAPTNDFKIPDAYKDKPWAAKIKSQDDLYKAFDGAQELIGKKVLPAMDLTKATPEDLAKFNEAHRPAEATAYKLAELGLDQEVGSTLEKIFHENGVPVHQAVASVKAYQAFENSKLQQATSAEGFKKEMSGKFGEQYDPVVKEVVTLHKQHTSPETQKLFETLPNNVLAAVYELTHNMAKAYGAKESGAQGDDKTGTPTGQSVEERRTGLRNKIAELEKRSHTAAEKQKLVDELHGTYK